MTTVSAASTRPSTSSAKPLNTDAAYQKSLDKMSVPELKAERSRIQQFMMTGRFTAEGYKAISHKLDLVNKELASRKTPSFQAKLDKMSLGELQKERTHHQQVLMTARWVDAKSRNAYEHELTLINREIASRSSRAIA